MNRAASHSHQAGEGSAFPEGLGDDAGVRQPVDPFEDMPRGTSHEEVGFGSLAFEDRVIIQRPSRIVRRGGTAAEALARLRLARAYGGN